jgi:hypothetical protein
MQISPICEKLENALFTSYAQAGDKNAAKRREIAESVIAGRKSGADMVRLNSISQPTVSRIVA